VLPGPFWPAKVRVSRALQNGAPVRIQAVGITDSQFYDRTLSLAQFQTLVKEESGGIHTFDAEPRLFRLAVEALRTSLAHAFDPQYAVSVSQVDLLPHQLDAVYKHILPLPRIPFLLADDPGAGKTIMAGLLMRELMQRQQARRVLILCPKALTDQWRREMWERFRERFALLTGDAISSAFGQNAWLENDLVIASVDLAVQEHILPGLEQAEWDLVIFDEAHKRSAYRYGLLTARATGRVSGPEEERAHGQGALEVAFLGHITLLAGGQLGIGGEGGVIGAQHVAPIARTWASTRALPGLHTTTTIVVPLSADAAQCQCATVPSIIGNRAQIGHTADGGHPLDGSDTPTPVASAAYDEEFPRPVPSRPHASLHPRPPPLPLRPEPPAHLRSIRSSFVVRRSSFVVRRSSFVVRQSSVVGRQSSVVSPNAPVVPIPLRPPAILARKCRVPRSPWKG
jgi:hypothetical protein